MCFPVRLLEQNDKLHPSDDSGLCFSWNNEENWWAFYSAVKFSVISSVTTKKSLPEGVLPLYCNQASFCFQLLLNWSPAVMYIFRCHCLVARRMQHGNEWVIRIYKGCSFQALLLKPNKVHHSPASSCFQVILCIFIKQKVTFTLNECWDSGAQAIWLKEIIFSSYCIFHPVHALLAFFKSFYSTALSILLLTSLV